MDYLGYIFNLILIDPLTNLFVALTVLTGNAGFAVIILTLIIRAVTLPLTLRQMRTTRMMAAIAPRMQEIQKRYKDPRRKSEEQMKLYKEAGVNPLGCFSSMLLQFPILIALYSVFRLATGASPEALISLSGRLYPFAYLRTAIPLPEQFLWLNLGQADPFIIPITVAASTYIVQKFSTLPPTDEKQAAQNSMMNIMMPLIFGWITISLPSGLGLYYVLSNLIQIAMQYINVGGGAINWRGLFGLNQEPVLPRMLELRNKQADAAKQLLPSNEDEPPDGTGGSPAKKPRGGSPNGTASANGSAAGTGSQRRRRYASGRRRGRR
jgi:YidC/Oxa1 family membrane protein insertase